MPARRVPLRSYKPLVSRCELQRRTPLRTVSDKRRAENVGRRVVVSAMREIAQGRCARCGEHTTVHGHERRPRSQGGSIIAPDCMLCPRCNSAVADSPRVSCWNGWYVSPKWPHDPALEPWEARALDGAVVDLRALVPEEVA
jgi:hypothetical protein